MKIYLASAYSHYDKREMEKRFQDVALMAGVLINKGIYAYSPILNSHPVVQYFSECETNYEYWRKFDEEMIKWADELWIYTFDGISHFHSYGVKNELAYALSLGKKTSFVTLKYNEVPYKTPDALLTFMQESDIEKFNI